MTSKDAGIFVAGAAVGAAVAILLKKHRADPSEDQPIIMGGGSLRLIPTGRNIFVRDVNDPERLIVVKRNGNPIRSRRVMSVDVITPDGLETISTGRTFRAEIVYELDGHYREIVMTCNRQGDFQLHPYTELVNHLSAGQVHIPAADIQSVKVDNNPPNTGFTDLIVHWGR